MSQNRYNRAYSALLETGMLLRIPFVNQKPFSVERGQASDMIVFAITICVLFFQAACKCFVCGDNPFRYTINS